MILEVLSLFVFAYPAVMAFYWAVAGGAYFYLRKTKSPA
ncbi:N-glycosyltransferase [Actinobacillus equuli]|nr:N-glycosyltransferase [Actinobacillus equuli]